MTKIIKYRDWEFETDFDFNKNSYANFIESGADECSCSYCKNFVANRENAFPEEVKSLFVQLGINYQKESEVCECGRKNNLFMYWGWFHFKGKIIKGKDCSVPLIQGGYTLDLEEITDNFSIGFSSSNTKSPSLFKINEGLIQIEFFTNLDWVIKEKYE